jgi:cysteine desulfurase
LAKGDFPFGNPASVHSTGKQARRFIAETKDFLYQHFSLKEDQHRLFFHSGASEGINTLIKGHADCYRRKGEKLLVAHLVTDHSAVRNLVPDLEADQHSIFEIGVDREGEFDDKAVEAKLLAHKGPKLLCLTWVNNETGVVIDLKRLANLKARTGCLVHVDAVQAPGKIAEYRELLSELDAYTFSGHKFGALKGIGFSFVQHGFGFRPLIRGGGQQSGLRSGTENALAVYSLMLALKELQEKFDFAQLKAAREEVESILRKGVGERLEIFSENYPHRAGNTIFFMLKAQKAQTLSVAFDLAGIDVSNGSACSSGAVVANPILLAMGRSEEEAKSGIRLSFSPLLTKSEASEFGAAILAVLTRYL